MSFNDDFFLSYSIFVVGAAGGIVVVVVEFLCGAVLVNDHQTKH